MQAFSLFIITTTNAHPNKDAKGLEVVSVSEAVPEAPRFLSVVSGQYKVPTIPAELGIG
jgi:hypothetical protein